MNGKQSLVAFGGLGLVTANLFAGPEKDAIGELGQMHFATAFKGLRATGLELLAVIVLTYLAGLSDEAANVTLVLVLGLWVLWAIRHWSGQPVVASKAKKQPKGGILV